MSAEDTKPQWGNTYWPHTMNQASCCGASYPTQKMLSFCLLFSNSPFCSFASIRAFLSHHHPLHHYPPMIQCFKIYLGLLCTSPWSWDLCLYPAILPGTASSVSQASQQVISMKCWLFCSAGALETKTSSAADQALSHPQKATSTISCVCLGLLGRSPLKHRRVTDCLSAKQRGGAVGWHFHHHFQEQRLLNLDWASLILGDLFQIQISRPHPQRVWNCGCEGKAGNLYFIMLPSWSWHKGNLGNHWPRKSGNTNYRKITFNISNPNFWKL